MAQAILQRHRVEETQRQHRGAFGTIPRFAEIKADPACCPNCLREMEPEQQTTIQRISWAAVQLATAVVAIAYCVFRLVRLVAAVILSVLGIVGFGLHSLGAKIVHPDDRRLLPGLDPQRGD